MIAFLAGKEVIGVRRLIVAVSLALTLLVAGGFSSIAPNAVESGEGSD